jgi:hypothetical protein
MIDNLFQKIFLFKSSESFLIILNILYVSMFVLFIGYIWYNVIGEVIGR